MARWKVAAVLVLVAAGLALARVTGPERSALTRPEDWLRDFFASVNGVLARAAEWTEPVWGAMLRYRALERENEELKAQIGRLKQEITWLEEYRLENRRLRRLLGLKEESPQYDMLLARVIGRHPDRWFHTVTIDRGARDGLKKGMPVINYQGLVGRVQMVSERSAQVLLLVDRQASVGALIQETRLSGVVKGTGHPGRLMMVHLPYDAPVASHQVVVTSGLGEGVPPGLPVGYVVQTVPEATGLMQRAEVCPFVDFYRLEEVMVIRRYGGR